MVNFACAFSNLTSAVGTLQFVIPNVSNVGKQISSARGDSTRALDRNASRYEKQKTMVLATSVDVITCL